MVIMCEIKAVRTSGIEKKCYICTPNYAKVRYARR